MKAAFYSGSLSTVRETFPGNWLHGFLDLALLSLLAAERDYGYGLAQRLAAAGLGEVPGGTIYPALLRLERQGLALAAWESSANGPRRKYFELTPAGRESLARLVSQWDTFARDIGALTASAQGRAR